MKHDFWTVWREEDGETVYMVKCTEQSGRPYFDVIKEAKVMTKYRFYGDFSIETADQAPADFFHDYIKTKTELIERENTAEDYDLHALN